MSYRNNYCSWWAVRLLLCAVTGIFSIGLQAGESPYANTVIINGKVITADNDDPSRVSTAQAVAIQGDTILAVGSNADIRKHVADWTEVIDAGGKTVLPGFIDTHNHLYETSTGFPWVVKSIPEELEVRVQGKSVDELVAIMGKAIQARAGAIPDGDWVQIGLNPAGIAVKAYQEGRITRASLDKLAPKNPVFVTTRGGSVINSMAMQKFEDYYGKKLPEEYWMRSRERGWTGEYTDFGRCLSVDLIPAQSHAVDKYIKGYFEVMQANTQIGLTTFKTHIQCEGGFTATTHLDRNHLMPLRLAWGHRWLQPFTSNFTEFYRRFGDWSGYGSERLWSIGSSVGGIDAGGVGFCTSLRGKTDAIESREQCPPAPEGTDLPFITDLNTVPNRGRRVQHLEVLARDAAEGRINGIPGWHVAGDGALSLMLQVYRKYMPDARIRQLRIETDHCHTVTPEQIQMAVRLNMTFSCNADNTPTKVIKSGYGEEYLTLNGPVASMLKAGARAVISEFGSQRYVRTTPFEDGVMWLTRKDKNGDTWGVPEEAVPDRMTLLLMMTRYGAYPLWKEHTLGSLEAGKKADIVILSGDYMAPAKADLDQLTAVMTMIGGKIQYEMPALRGNTFRFNTDTAQWEVHKSTPTDAWRWDKAPELPPLATGPASGT